MGSRLSQPRGPAGTTESSLPTSAPPPPTPKSPWSKRRPVNSRGLVAPVAAATMALLLFVYARTSIRAAKANAQRHRDADSGGQGVSLINESRRRHGVGEKVEGRGVVRELAGEVRKEILGEQKKKGDGKGEVKGDGRRGRSDEDERLRELMGRKNG